MSQLTTYPPPPTGVAPGVTAPSAAFRAQVTQVIFAILAFIVVYLILIVLALVLVWLCVKAGLLVMFGIGFHGITLLIGAGVILMGIMVLFFLLKFIFSKPEETAERGVQIFEKDEPELFAFIRKVADEVGAPYPRKVFLIPDVNASVFYNSSFWSLILPAPKNLNIGLGLVNALNISEFKAVLAHEFGHFSQDSMRLGSYVYYVNKVIYDMLYRNTGWAGALGTIAGFHEIIAFFANMAVNIVRGIQWVLQKMYGFINRQYLKLSREMEFHADTIGAAVSGGNNSIQSLRQVTIASEIFSTTMNQCNRLLREQKKPENFYTGQTAAARFFGSINNLTVQGGRVNIPDDFLSRQRVNRVVFQNQWESHPSMEDREANIQQLGLVAPVIDQSAWSVFANPAKWQTQITQFMYQEAHVNTEVVADDAFVRTVEEHLSGVTMPPFYKGYFNNYYFTDPHLTDRAQQLQAKSASETDIADLFKENYTHKIEGLSEDLDILEKIRLGEIDTKTFDFDGQKYPVASVEDIKQRILTEKANMEKELAIHEHRIFDTFYSHALARGGDAAQEILHGYQSALAWQQWVKAFEATFTEALNVIYLLDSNQFICNNQMVPPFTNLVMKVIPQIREQVNNMPENVQFDAELQPKLAVHFQGEEVNYGIANFQPHVSNLVDLYHTIVGIRVETAKTYFGRLKRVLELQLAR